MTTSTTSTLTPVGEKVQAFYEANPFPAFDLAKYRTRDDVRERASPYVQLLDRQLPHTARIADVGCGTGQLVNFLALRERRDVTGVDFSTVSLGQSIADWGVQRMLGDQYESFDVEKKRTWWADQFAHPHETVHTVSEVLGWFEECGLDYAASLPPIELGGDEAHVNLFPRRGAPPRTMGRLASARLRELQWIWQLRWTGG